jgi:glycosyltransferase involved in cell wall biosynthesis
VAELQQGGSTHFNLAIGRKSLSVLREAWALRRLLRRWRPDIVHARSRLPAWLAWALLRTLPAPRPRLITSVHGLNSPGRYSSIMTRGEAVICVSETVRRHVMRQWPATPLEKLRVIERGVDSAAFSPAFAPDEVWRENFFRDHPQLAGGRLLLLPGRGSRGKGHACAIRLLARLRAAGHDARLCLLGARQPQREAYVEELEALAREQGVQAQLAIAPPRPDIAKVYAVSDLVLQLSQQPEAFGRTVLEALAMARPVLGWNLGGVGETLARHFPAGAIDAFDEEALAARAQHWLREPPIVSATLDATLARMQAQTLDLYEAIAAA